MTEKIVVKCYIDRKALEAPSDDAFGRWMANHGLKPSSVVDVAADNVKVDIVTADGRFVAYLPTSAAPAENRAAILSGASRVLGLHVETALRGINEIDRIMKAPLPPVQMPPTMIVVPSAVPEIRKAALAWFGLKDEEPR